MVHLVLTGSGGAQGWLDIQRPGITVCKDDQGLAVDLALEADTAQMQRWLIGLVPFRDLVADGHARFLGPSRLAKASPRGSTRRCTPRPCAEASNAGSGTPSRPRLRPRSRSNRSGGGSGLVTTQMLVGRLLVTVPVLGLPSARGGVVEPGWHTHCVFGLLRWIGKRFP